MIDCMDRDEGRICVMSNRITHLTKDWENNITFIHLDTGEVIASTTSMNVIQARINSEWQKNQTRPDQRLASRGAQGGEDGDG